MLSLKKLEDELHTDEKTASHEDKQLDKKRKTNL